MDNADFRAWLTRMRFTNVAAARALHLQRRQIQNLKNGTSRITPRVAAMCEDIEKSQR